MATLRSKLCLAILLIASLACCSLSLEDSHHVHGRLLIPDHSYKASEITLILSTDKGEQIKAFAQRDGQFVISDVPTGSHVLTVSAMGILYPEVRIDVNKGGLLRAFNAANKLQVFPTPLALQPMMPLDYYERRKPLDLWSLVKSPYGLMICLMGFCIVVLPMLKMSPEELDEYYGRKDPERIAERRKPE